MALKPYRRVEDVMMARGNRQTWLRFLAATCDLAVCGPDELEMPMGKDYPIIPNRLIVCEATLRL